MEFVDEICELLQSHVNRDKVVNLVSYGLKLWGSSTGSAPILSASTRLAGARAALRMFDDAAVIKNMVRYGLGKQEGPVWGTLGVASSLFTLGYVNAEKLQFLMDSGILVVSQDTEFRIRTAHKLFWLLSVFVALLRSLRELHITSQASQSPTRTKCAGARVTHAALTSTKFALDVLHVATWLPPGWLWGSKLSTPQASGLATAAAVMGLLVHYHSKKF